MVKHKEAAALNNEVASLAVFSRFQQKAIETTFSEGEKNSIVCYCRKYSGLKKVLQFFQLFRAYHIGYKLIKKEKGKPDLIHLNVVFPAGLFALYLKWILRIPYVTTEHSTEYAAGANSMSALKRFVTAIILRNSSYILPVSKDLGKHLSKLAPNTPQVVITNVVDENIFLSIDHSSSKVNNKKELIHISTLNQNKNIPGLLRVIKKISSHRHDFILRIISDGDMVNARNYCLENGILDSFVIFEGTKSTSEIANAIAKADALVLFSDLENFPCVIAEAMMCGIPVISTSVNGIPEHVNDSNGILIEKGDESALDLVLNTFLDGKYTFDKNNIIEYALNNFSYKVVSEKFSEVYKQVLTN